MRSTDFANSVPDPICNQVDLNLEHLQAELARIDVKIRQAIWRWQSSGQDPGDAFRGLYVSDEGAAALMSRPIFTNWGHTAATDAETNQKFAIAQREANLQAKALSETAHCQGHVPGLEHLVVVFDLSPFDVDILLVCLAPGLDLRYESLYGYLQDNVTLKRPSVNLVLDLLCDPSPDRMQKLIHFSDNAPLFKHHLLEFVGDPIQEKTSLLRQTITTDETVLAWLLGNFRPHTMIKAYTTLIDGDRDPANLIIAENMLSQLDRAVLDNPVLVFHGPDEACQDATARALSAQVKRPLLKVDLDALTGDRQHQLKIIELALRDTRLINAIPYLAGWDAYLLDGAPHPDILGRLCSYPGLVIVAGRSSWQPKGIQRDRILRWYEFPIPSYSQRLVLWKYFTDQIGSSEDIDLVPIAGQFQLTTGQIRDAVASARDIAARNGGVPKSGDIFAAARGHSNPHLAGLALKIIPRYDWKDIVLPNDQVDLLREIVATVRSRPKVLDDWGLGRKLVSSRGVTALFAGPPGTGKTMAAEIIAAELGLDLYKINLSTVVSKYIGETEKNLERIFNEAETSNAILFFDEADALFGKRSEVRDSHDRYANIEISYLLQRMEAYNGVTILATNLRANLDEAFTRRLQFAVDFPFPDQDDRLRIWQTLFPPDVPADEDLDFEQMANRFKLAGGNIRNILVNAAYLAADDGQRVTMDHLLRGTRRELQKMGRLIGEEHLTIEP